MSVALKTHKMSGKILFTVVALFIVIQLTNGEQDPRLVSCYNKAQDLWKKIDFKKIPACFDTKKLIQAKKYADVLKNYFDQLPNECKSITKENMSYCVNEWCSLIASRNNDIKTAVTKLIVSVVEGGKTCLNEIIVALNGINVMNGCN